MGYRIKEENILEIEINTDLTVYHPLKQCEKCASATPPNFDICYYCDNGINGHDKFTEEFDDIFTIGNYVKSAKDHGLTETIRDFKEGGNNEVVKKVATWGFEYQYSSTDIDMVTAPPSSSEENQMAPIVRHIAADGDMDYKLPFEKEDDIKAQKDCDGLEERIENIQDSISLEENLEVSSILIVDDIITSGMTISECVRLLKEEGIPNVYGMAIGRNEDFKSLTHAEVLEEIEDE